MRLILSLAITVILVSLQAQTAQEFFDRGVDAFQKKQYIKADSMFTQSLLLQRHKDTYFSRAAVMQKVKNMGGYCSDLAHASVLGDSEAEILFKRDCGKVKHSFVDENNKEVTEPESKYRIIKYENKYDPTYLAVKLDKQNAFVSSFYIIDSTYGNFIIEKLPSYRYGILGLYSRIEKRIVYPQDALEKNVKGEIWVRFLVEKDGTVSETRVITPFPGFPSLSTAVLKALENMPRWEPGIVNGKPAQLAVNLPIPINLD